MLVTILTPTYNRADKLNKLYESLKDQTCADFEWLVVDDGSTDSTQELVSGFKADSSFDIRYVKKLNGGKHTALNLGIEMIESELTIIVDSDDYLAPDAVKIICEFHERYKGRIESDKLCGYSFLRAYSNGEVNTGEFPVDEAVDTFRQQRINNNLLGDKAEVYYTDVLKKYPFEVFEDEKFMPEDSVWLKMSGPYKMVHANRIIYYCDYLEGGLTKSGRKMKIHSPYGMMYRSAVYLGDPEVNFKVKIKMMLLYHIYSMFADKKYGRAERKIEAKGRCFVRKRPMYYLLIAPAAVLFMRWK